VDLIITPYTLLNLVLMTNLAGTRSWAAFMRMLLFKYDCLDSTNWQITVNAGNSPLQPTPNGRNFLLMFLKSICKRNQGQMKEPMNHIFSIKRPTEMENILT